MIVTIRIPLMIGGLAHDPIEYDYDTESGRCEALIIAGVDYRLVPEIYPVIMRWLGGHQTVLDKYLSGAIADAIEAREEMRICEAL